MSRTTQCNWNKREGFSVRGATEKDETLTMEPRVRAVQRVATNPMRLRQQQGKKVYGVTRLQTKPALAP